MPGLNSVQAALSSLYCSPDNTNCASGVKDASNNNPFWFSWPWNYKSQTYWNNEIMKSGKNKFWSSTLDQITN